MRRIIRVHLPKKTPYLHFLSSLSCFACLLHTDFKRSFLAVEFLQVSFTLQPHPLPNSNAKRPLERLMQMRSFSRLDLAWARLTCAEGTKRQLIGMFINIYLLF
jgi:hypothetical protein